MGYIKINSTGRNWLEAHIETFIKPHLKSVPVPVAGVYPCNTLAPKVISGLVACWVETKRRAGDRTILLPGRDTWLFEVLARLEGWDTEFVPECSSLAKDVVAKRKDYSGYFAVDSGNKGSVPMALKCKEWALVHCSDSATRTKRQLFPRAKMSDTYIKSPDGKIGSYINHTIYEVYSALEGHPKYWTQGARRCGAYPPPSREELTKLHPGGVCSCGVGQSLDPALNFERCAQVTLHVANHVLGRAWKGYDPQPRISLSLPMSTQVRAYISTDDYYRAARALGSAY